MELQNSKKTKADSSTQILVWLVALFLAVAGAKLWLVQLYGSPMWLWDQWYEVGQFFKPWLAGQATWHDYFAPYCEHRIFFTRLLDVGVVLANGRLEPMFQMTVNALIHAGYACGLAFCLWDFLGRKNGWLICCLLLPFFTLPYAEENTLWAFNSQAYLLAVFSLPTLVWLGFARAGSWRWWLGLATAVLGLFTMASGLLTPLAVAGLVVFRAGTTRRFEKSGLVTLGVSLAVTGFGASLFTPFAGDEPLKAHSVRQFIAALTRNLTWPFFHAPWMALFIALPLLGLAFLYFRPAFKEARAAEFLLLLGLWSFMQSLALAYGRGNFGEDVPASRYMDKLNVFVIASLFATLLLAQFWLNGPVSKKFTLLAPLAFAAVIFFGLVRISNLVVDDLLVPTRMMELVGEERVATYMSTGNEHDFFEEPTVSPDPKVVLGVLRDAPLQTIMPAANLAPTDVPVAGRLSGISNWLLRHAVLILYAGLGLGIALLGLALVRNPQGLGWENLPAFLILLALLCSLGFVWTKSPIRRETVERQLQYQLVGYFKSVNNPQRAAIHEHKAELLNAP